MLRQRDQTVPTTIAADGQPTRRIGGAAMRIALPDGLASLPRVQVSDLGRDLNTYLDLGYDVRSAADGWAELGCADSSFVLVQATLPATVRPAVHLHIVGSAIRSA